MTKPSRRLLLLAALLCAAAPSSAADGSAEANPATAIHLDWIDPSVDPARDFFAYANGNWLKANPIPDAYPDWSVDRQMNEENERFIRQLLEDAAADSAAPAGSDTRRIGDFYSSGMDEAAIEAAGATPLQPELARIAALTERRQLPALLAHLQLIGVDAAFAFGQMQDFRDSRKVIGAAAQGGLGLPNRDYYLDKDEKFAAIRRQYREHVARMFALQGEATADAGKQADTVLAFETRLARAAMSEAAQRDPRAVYHPLRRAALAAATPGFAWDDYFAELGIADIGGANLMMPGFFRQLTREVRTTPLADWRTYLRWQLLKAFADCLSTPFVNEGFRLTQLVSGAKELPPRWQRITRQANRTLGFAIGRVYVERRFPEAQRAAARAMVADIHAAYAGTLAAVPWMSRRTREAALRKLARIEERVGYPDRWRDYSALAVDRGPFVLNVQRANRFLQQRELAKIGQPVDRSEWDMTPQTINAYYDASLNSINVPAAQLQPPYFYGGRAPAVDFGAVGATIGHELTHGFDDEGSQFDGDGNLRNWWSENDRRRFVAGTDCVAAQYSRVTVDGGLHLQGKLVAGEAVADLGGLLIAYRAFHASGAADKVGTVAGLSPDQQFFLAFAQSWASAERPESARQRAVADPHPPPAARVNMTLANIAEFRRAFAIAGDAPMAAQHPCQIW